MLQQTQVQTVLPYWHRWMHDLPTIASLAKAPTARVLKLWEGLGYYRRARNLQRAAQRIIVQAHGGRFPQAYADVLALPESDVIRLERFAASPSISLRRSWTATLCECSLGLRDRRGPARKTA